MIAAMWIAWLTRRFPRTLRRVARACAPFDGRGGGAEFAGWCAVGELGEASWQDPVVHGGEEGELTPRKPRSPLARAPSRASQQPGTRDGAGRAEHDTAEPDLNHQPSSSAAASGGPSSPVRLRPRMTCRRAVRN